MHSLTQESVVRPTETLKAPTRKSSALATLVWKMTVLAIGFFNENGWSLKNTPCRFIKTRWTVRIYHLCFFWLYWNVSRIKTSPPQTVIHLRDVTSIGRIDMKPYCLLLETKDRRYFISLKNDGEVYGWLDDIYSRTSMGASNPTNFVHKVHVGFDPVTGAFTVRALLHLINSP